MDPFIESQKWADFHTRFITALSEVLMPRVRPAYFVDVEERVYVERDPDDPVMVLRPDVSIVDTFREEGRPYAATATAVGPLECLMPMPEEAREVYLTIRRKDRRNIVTVIELLSPANKRPGAKGFDQYLERRDHVLASFANLVELDLLRGGRRMPLVGKLPPGDFTATIARLRGRPRAEVYVWSLDQRLPVIPMPLAHPDPDVPVDLQEVFNLVYDRAGYDYSLDYREPPIPPLDPQRATWVEDILQRTLEETRGPA
jgi:hypothetical protein